MSTLRDISWHLKRKRRTANSRNTGSQKIFEIESLPPATILEGFNAEYIDFVSVGLEGCDLAILQSFDFSKTKVKMISVENNRSPSIANYLDAQGFDLVKCIGYEETY